MGRVRCQPRRTFLFRIPAPFLNERKVASNLNGFSFSFSRFVLNGPSVQSNLEFLPEPELLGGSSVVMCLAQVAGVLVALCTTMGKRYDVIHDSCQCNPAFSLAVFA